MSSRPLTIFCSTKFGEAAMSLLTSETSGHLLVRDDAEFARAEVAFGQPDPEWIIASKHLRWVHVSTAGYTRYDNDTMRAALREKNIVFTNSSWVYAAPCAQHVLAMMLADARQLMPSHDSQRTDHAWHQGPRRQASYLLDGQTVLLLGMGAIARHLIGLLAPFGMNIVAVRRSGEPYPGIEVIDESALPAALAQADHVVNVLPESPSTIGFMDKQRFSCVKPGAKFYNVGRGKTVSQPALLEALQSGQLGAAYLDVTDPEPLPAEHPLWTAPNCFITPHTAGGHKGESIRQVQHFVRNLRAFEAGEPLEDRVLEG